MIRSVILKSLNQLMNTTMMGSGRKAVEEVGSGVRKTILKHNFPFPSVPLGKVWWKTSYFLCLDKVLDYHLCILLHFDLSHAERENEWSKSGKPATHGNRDRWTWGWTVPSGLAGHHQALCDLLAIWAQVQGLGSPSAAINWFLYWVTYEKACSMNISQEMVTN